MTDTGLDYLISADDLLDRELLEEQLSRLGFYNKDFIDSLIEEYGREDVCQLCHNNIEFYVAAGDSCEGRFCDRAVDLWLEESSWLEDEDILEFADRYYTRLEQLRKETERWKSPKSTQC